MDKNGIECSNCGRELSNPVSIQAGMGPICRAKLKDGWESDEGDLLNPRAEYSARLVSDEFFLVIDKNNGGLTVTNDADNVVDDVFPRIRALNPQPIIVYRDTDQRYDVLRHDEVTGKFLGFRPLTWGEMARFQEVMKGLEYMRAKR